MDRVDGFVQHIVALAALDTEAAGRHAARAVLRALALRLPPTEAGALDALRAELVAREDELAREGPAAAAASALAVDIERAATIANAVLVAALERLGADAPAVLAALPPELRPTPTSSAGDMPVARPARATTDDRTLAGGRPGSGHPLADAAPERAHAHSVARSDDPHGDSRLSGARPGAAPGSSLADGRPGTDRPLADAKG